MSVITQGERTAVYKARATDGHLLYVGVARNWGARWAQHAYRSPFFVSTASLEVEWCESRDAALAREAQLIRELAPRHNIIRQRRRLDRSEARARPLTAGLCEVCRREPAYSFSWFPDAEDRYADYSGVWKVTGECTSNSEHYYITFERWLTRDWIHHLRTTKHWFNELDFIAAVLRVPNHRIRAVLGREARPRLA